MNINTLKIAICQIDSVWHAPSTNIGKLEDYLESLDNDCSLLVLPEMWTTGFSMKPDEVAHEVDDQYLRKIQSLCKEHQIAICGTYPYRDGTNYHNRALLFEPNGKIHTYDKQYLFSPSGEDVAYQAGTISDYVKYEGWNIKLQICYDLRFPESVRDEGKPDLIIYMANWPKPRIYQWQQLLVARAIENQCYVVGVNRVGQDGNSWDYPGHSMMVDYSGQVLLTMGQEPLSSSIEIDKIAVEKYRGQLPFYLDKKF